MFKPKLKGKDNVRANIYSDLNQNSNVNITHRTVFIKV